MYKRRQCTIAESTQVKTLPARYFICLGLVKGWDISSRLVLEVRQDVQPGFLQTRILCTYCMSTILISTPSIRLCIIVRIYLACAPQDQLPLAIAIG